MLGSDAAAGAGSDVDPARVVSGEINEVPEVVVIGVSGIRLSRRKRRG